MEKSEIAKLIRKGGVYDGIEGGTPEEVYKEVSRTVPLPDGLTREVFYNALVDREKILSTAVGGGIALPHARTPLIRQADDMEICVVYLRDPINMGAPDGRSVFVMFVLLTSDAQLHLEVLSSLASMFRTKEFCALLESRAGVEALTEKIEKMD